MPINERRRDDIAAAVAAYDSANPKARLPRNAARLLAVMFPTEDVCQQSLESHCCGRVQPRLPALLKRLVECRVPVEVTGIGQYPRHLSAAPAAGAAVRSRGREKVFGPGRAVPLDRNAKARIPPTRAPGIADTASRARVGRADHPPAPVVAAEQITATLADPGDAVLPGEHTGELQGFDSLGDGGAGAAALRGYRGNGP